jgi:hypothetical protein
MIFSYHSLLDAGGIDGALADFQFYTGQRSAWRTGDRPPCGNIETAFVTGARETVMLWLMHYGAGEVGTFLAVGNKCLLITPHDQTSVMLLWIIKGQRPAYRDLLYIGDLEGRHLSAAFAKDIL